MEVNDKNQTPQGKEASNATIGNDAGSPQRDEAVEEDEAIEEDGTPVLDEEDLEQNALDEEEADNVQWEDPKEQ